MHLLFERSWDENHHVCPFWRVSRKSWKILRVYVVLGDAVSKLETFVWILSHISRSITWSLFTLKAPYLLKWSILTWSFMWWCQFIDWLKFETRPSSLLNFGTAYWAKSCRAFSWFSVLWTKIGEFLGKVMNFKLLTLILFCFLTYSYKCLPLQLLSSRTTWPGQGFSSSFFRTFPSISLTSNRNGFSYY